MRCPIEHDSSGFWLANQCSTSLISMLLVLMLCLSVTRDAITIGPGAAVSILGLDVRWYAPVHARGGFRGLFLARFLAGRVGLNPDSVVDAAPWVVDYSIVGARVSYVLLHGELSPSRRAVNVRLGSLFCPLAR